MTVENSLVSGTLPSKVAIPGDGGIGISVFDSPITITAVRVEKSAAAGVSIIDSDADVGNQLVVDQVAIGNLVVRDGIAIALTGVGDGVIVSRGTHSKVNLQHVWVTSATRAGILFANSGSVDTCFADRDQYGLATQGDADADIGPDNEFAGSKAAVFDSGALDAP